jgi:hypothetical protein
MRVQEIPGLCSATTVNTNTEHGERNRNRSKHGITDDAVYAGLSTRSVRKNACNRA